MTKANYHTHTQFCDGTSTAEEMVEAALKAGFEKLGFSGHSYTFFDESYCMSKESTLLYRDEIARLKEKYKDRIEILCGVEQDYYSLEPTTPYDYVIGSVHYLHLGDEYIPVDEGHDNHRYAIEKYFGGDIYAFAEKYFETAAKVVEKTGCDIIGHFDLISKYNEKDKLYDTENPRYITAWKKALDTLIPTGKIFEVNTGAIAKGHRVSPYPDFPMADYIKARGGRLIMSSDCHNAQYLTTGFEEFEYLCK